MTDAKERREHPRGVINAQLLWSVGRREGMAKLRDASAGGARIRTSDPELVPGTKLVATVAIGRYQVAGIKAEIVEARQGDLTLRFTDLSEEQKIQLHLLIATGTLRFMSGIGL